MGIVIVDDDAQVRAQVRRIAEIAGLEVLGEAANGGEGIAIVEQLRPKVVVMDARMPVMNGLIATQHLLSLHPDIKVIAHTSDEKLAAQMVQIGAVASAPKGTGPALMAAICEAYKTDENSQRRGGPPAPSMTAAWGRLMESNRAG